MSVLWCDRDRRARIFVRTPNAERPGSTAKFIHVWKNDGGTWRIARVLSFDHLQ
jgi:hypothetical protein